MRVALLLIIVMCSALSVNASDTGKMSLFCGKWDTDLGVIELTQTNNTVKGTFSNENRELKGTVYGNTLVGTFKKKNKTVNFQLTASMNGEKITGMWTSGKKTGKWNGKRISKTE